MADTTTVTVSKAAAELLREIAAGHGVTPRVYLESLLHYAGSIRNRPGSWEANTPFNLENYIPNPTVQLSGIADRWF